MLNEHFRGVIWPRGDNRYVVIGMLVTSEPIPEFEGKNEIILDGSTFGGLSEIVSMLPQKEAARRFQDANDILTSLQYLVKQ